MLPILLGTPNTAGTLVTGGGLIFFSGTLDQYLRAYDISAGRELWRARLPVGAQATPLSYVARDGRQMIVIAAGGHVGLNTRLGDSILAFALPVRPSR
jgi:quinoprotein glucose dehydrogenase